MRQLTTYIPISLLLCIMYYQPGFWPAIFLSHGFFAVHSQAGPYSIRNVSIRQSLPTCQRLVDSSLILCGFRSLGFGVKVELFDWKQSLITRKDPIFGRTIHELIKTGRNTLIPSRIITPGSNSVNTHWRNHEEQYPQQLALEGCTLLTYW